MAIRTSVPALVLLLALACATRDAGQGAGGADATSRPRYHGFLMLERWSRVEPPANITTAGLLTFREDATLPRFADVDGRCGYHEGDWTQTGTWPPSYGTVHMQTPRLGEVTWKEDADGAGWDPPDWDPRQDILGWDTGDTLRVSAPGGDLPGFALEDRVPAQANLTSQDLSKLAYEELVIPRDTPFALSWEPVPTEIVALVLQFDDAGHERRGLWCFFPGMPGYAVITTEALRHLSLSADVRYTNFYFGGASRKSVALERVDLEMVTWKGQAVRVRVQDGRK